MRQATLIFIFFLLALSLKLSAQTDTAAVKPVDKKAVYGKARTATIMSACLPGLGQVYNHKWWKAPIIYAGIGGFGYMFYSNNTKYNNYRSALKASLNNGGYASIDGRTYSTSQLQTQKLVYRKYRDYGVVGMGAVYILNIIDANVDAHLRTFDVDDNLSLRIGPWHTTCPTASGGLTLVQGFSLKLNFK